MALGATIDFEAGNIKRAPILFQKGNGVVLSFSKRTETPF